MYKYILISVFMFCALVLYGFFGLRLMHIAWRSDSKASQKKELEEVCAFSVINPFLFPCHIALIFARLM
jgi:hypothetical protein